jgi:hypothetical protein
MEINDLHDFGRLVFVTRLLPQENAKNTKTRGYVNCLEIIPCRGTPDKTAQRTTFYFFHTYIYLYLLGFTYISLAGGELRPHPYAKWGEAAPATLSAVALAEADGHVPSFPFPLPPYFKEQARERHTEAQ